MELNHKYTALVTGFGPFGKHTSNASWEAVKELSKLCVDSKELGDVRVVIKEIPVSYDDVDNYIPKLWKEYDPIVVVHVGVSGIADCLNIEQCARSNGYARPDIYNKFPDENNINVEVLETKLNLINVCETVNETECTACVSYDAGRYLCEYIFYKSLEIDPMKTLFIHVPDFNKYSTVRSAKGLYHILCYIIRNAKKNQGQL